MEYFTQHNTKGYTDEQLRDLNSRLELTIDEMTGLRRYREDAIEMAAERIQRDFDTEIAEEGK